MTTREENLQSLRAEQEAVRQLEADYKKLNKEEKAGEKGAEIQAQIRETTARIRELQSATDDATNSMETLGTVGAASLSGIIDSLSKTGAEAKEGIDAYYKNLTTLFGDKKNLFVELLNSLGADYSQSMDQFTTDSENFAYRVGGTINEMYERFYTTDLPLYFGSMEEFAAFGEEIYYSVGSGYAAMASMGDDAARQIETSALMAKGLGFTATEMMDAMDAQFSASGEFSNGILREITTYSNAISAVTGDSNKVIAKGILEIRTNFETFANVSVETAAETIGGLRSIGLEVKDLQAVTNKFLNFDQGAESLANLNTVFGMQLDTMSMMEAASQDPFDAMMMLRDAFIETGGDFENLTQQQKNLLAQQANLDVEAAARLFDPDRAVADMADLTAATEAQAEEGVLTTEESLASLAESITKVSELGDSFSNEVFNRMAMRDLHELSNSSLVAEASMTRFARTAGTKVPEAVAGMLPEEMGRQLIETVGQAKSAVITGVESTVESVGGMFGDAGRDIPGNLLAGINDSPKDLWFGIAKRIGERIPEVGIGTAVAGEGVNVRPGGDVYVPSDGDPIILADGDTAFIAQQGGPITGGLQELGDSVTENIQTHVTDVYQQHRTEATPEILNEGFSAVVERFRQISSQEIDETSARASSDIREAISALRDTVQRMSTAGGNQAERPINMNLTVKLGDSDITEIKNQLINAPDVGGVDFVREVIS